MYMKLASAYIRFWFDHEPIHRYEIDVCPSLIDLFIDKKKNPLFLQQYTFFVHKTEILHSVNEETRRASRTNPCWCDPWP